MLPVILSATFIYAFDFNVVNVALPSLHAHLRAGPVALELIVSGYAFAYAAGLVTGGRLGDLFGYRRLFVYGMAAFIIASLLCGLSATPAELVAARIAQGLAAAAMVPQVLALITSVFSPPRTPGGPRLVRSDWRGQRRCGPSTRRTHAGRQPVRPQLENAVLREPACRSRGDHSRPPSAAPLAQRPAADTA